MTSGQGCIGFDKVERKMNTKRWFSRYLVIFSMIPFSLLSLLLLIGVGNPVQLLDDKLANKVIQTRVFAEFASLTPSIKLQNNLSALSENNALTGLTFSIIPDNGVAINLAARSLVIEYRDPSHRFRNLQWTWDFEGEHDDDLLLEEGEQTRISITLPEAIAPNAGTVTPFVVEVRPTQGASLTLYRELPAQFQSVMTLH